MTLMTMITTSATPSALSPEATASLGVLVLLVLLALLLSKEMAFASSHPRARRASKVFNVAALPLALTYVVIAIARISQTVA